MAKCQTENHKRLAVAIGDTEGREAVDGDACSPTCSQQDSGPAHALALQANCISRPEFLYASCEWQRSATRGLSADAFPRGRMQSDLRT